MRKSIIIIMSFLPILLFAQEKSHYDLDFSRLAKRTVISGEISPKYASTSSEFIEISLTQTGYFTVGTTSGITESYLDNHCQITYGHPYAMTSFPVIAVDGFWYRFEDYFSHQDSMNMFQEAGSLMSEGNEKGKLTISFSLVAKSQEAAVEFILKITNSDSISHSVAPGFVIDDAQSSIRCAIDAIY